MMGFWIVEGGGGGIFSPVALALSLVSPSVPLTRSSELAVHYVCANHLALHNAALPSV